ncbi:MAG TPA: LamG-like jellyroll fold domain-containing protein [Planktothrix sp.]
MRTFMLPLLVAILLVQLFAPPAVAQAVSWTNVDVGNGTTGSFTYTAGTPPSYNVSGSNTGLYGNADWFGFTNVPTCGNIEIEAQLVSESSANNGAFAGLAIRDSYDISAGESVIGESVGGNLIFTGRANGASQTLTTGPATAFPIYVKLAKAGNTITGSYSSDGESWTVLGTYTSSSPPVMPNQYYVGMVASSTDNSLNTAVFKYLTYSTSVPQTGSNLLLWLRSDNGITSSSGKVSSWADSSGNSNTATQSTGTLQPSLTTGALNSGVLPAVTFSGSTYLGLPTDFANMTAGGSIFIVLSPSSATATGDQIAVGNASNANAFFSQTVGKNASLYAYNASTSSSVSTTTTPLTVGSYQLLEEVFTPGTTHGTGTIYLNGTQEATLSTLVSTLTNVSRTSNCVGAGVGAANPFSGGIAEILLFNAPVTSSQRAALESYFLSKFGIGNTPTLDAPTFSPSPGVFAPGQGVSITQDQNATCFFTTNGTTPTNSSQFSNLLPITLNETPVTIKTIAEEPFFNNSSVVTGTFQTETNSAAFTRSGLILWLRGDNSVTTSGSNVTAWGDVSGSNNNASGVASHYPTIVTNAINGRSAVSFASGSSQYLQLPTISNLGGSGASVFAVVKPASVTAGARVLDMGNGSASDNLELQLTSSTGAGLYVLNAGTSSNVTGTSALTLNNWQLLEGIDTSSSSATLYTNGVQQQTNPSMQNLQSVSRADNFVGQGSGTGNYFNGQLAELLVYNRNLSASEQAAVEGYLENKYFLINVNTTPAPTISVSAGTLTAPTTVALEGPATAQIFYTVDGTTPTSSSPAYTAPVLINQSETLKAISVINGVSSSVSSAAYTLNSTQFPAPGTTSTPLQLNLQLPGVSIPQSSNQH